jgi:hypothetical protein
MVKVMGAASHAEVLGGRKGPKPGALPVDQREQFAGMRLL